MREQHLVRQDERSIGELFSELANESSTLIRQEMALAQAEMTRKAAAAGRNAALIGAGGAVGYGAFLVLLAGIVSILSSFMPVWLAALIVAAVVGLVSFYLINSGLTKLKRAGLAPHETVESLKEDVRWLKRQVS